MFSGEIGSLQPRTWYAVARTIGSSEMGCEPGWRALTPLRSALSILADERLLSGTDLSIRLYVVAPGRFQKIRPDGTSRRRFRLRDYIPPPELPPPPPPEPRSIPPSRRSWKRTPASGSEPTTRPSNPNTCWFEVWATPLRCADRAVRNGFAAAAKAPDVAWRRPVSALAESDTGAMRTATTAAAMIVFVDTVLLSGSSSMGI